MPKGHINNHSHINANPLFTLVPPNTPILPPKGVLLNGKYIETKGLGKISLIQSVCKLGLEQEGARGQILVPENLSWPGHRLTSLSNVVMPVFLCYVCHLRWSRCYPPLGRSHSELHQKSFKVIICHTQVILSKTASKEHKWVRTTAWWLEFQLYQ